MKIWVDALSIRSRAQNHKYSDLQDGEILVGWVLIESYAFVAIPSILLSIIPFHTIVTFLEPLSARHSGICVLVADQQRYNPN